MICESIDAKHQEHCDCHFVQCTNNGKLQFIVITIAEVIHHKACDLHS